MIAWWNQLFGGFVWGNRSLRGFVASLLCGIDRLVDSLGDWSLGGIDRLVELIALWIRLGDWSFCGINCLVELIALWNQLFGGIDRLVELIALWNRSFGGFAWGIDRLVESIALWNWLVGGIDRFVELVDSLGGLIALCGIDRSLCVESIAWWNWFLWRRIRNSGGGGFDRNGGRRREALCGIDRFVELIRSERFAWGIDRLIMSSSSLLSESLSLSKIRFILDDTWRALSIYIDRGSDVGSRVIRELF